MNYEVLKRGRAPNISVECHIMHTRNRTAILNIDSKLFHTDVTLVINFILLNFVKFDTNCN
jgi:hypothetical protein